MRRSIAIKLLLYFLTTGLVLFSALLFSFFLFSSNFASLAVVKSLEGMAGDIGHSFYVDQHNQIRLDDSEVRLQWGFDALYSNLGYRLIAIESQKEALRSVNAEIQGSILNAVPLNIPDGYSQLKDFTQGEQGRLLDLYRQQIVLDGIPYHFDLIRTDLLGKLANEAVFPAVADMLVYAVAITLLLLLTVNVIAIRLIVKPVKTLSDQVAGISPEKLSERIQLDNVPTELVPITQALNDALSRVEEGFNVQKRFVADAAHELRTPLTVLLNRLELSMSESEIKQRLLNDTRYMSRIVEQLLDLSRIQNTANRQLQDIDLVAITKDMLEMLAPLTIDREQTLALESRVQMTKVQADPGELSIAIKNVIENAIKHAGQGAKIRVTLKPRYLCVEDSGEGIPAGLQSRIFDRFWRANQSDLSGSGLGLAITREVLTHFRASIKVSKSEDLGGAKFELNFAEQRH